MATSYNDGPCNHKFYVLIVYFKELGKETLSRSASPKLRETSVAYPADFLAKVSQTFSLLTLGRSRASILYQ